MNKILFIYNPNSGKGRVKENIYDICTILTKDNLEDGEAPRHVEVYETKGPLDAMNKVQQEAGDYDLVVCAGGDGTLSEVVSGMMDAEKQVPIGFIPVGTTNDTRSGFGLPKDMLEATKICIEGKPFQVDVGSFNNEYFTYVASLGSLSAVSCFIPQEMKKIFGYGAYFVEGLRQLIRMESYEMTIEFNGGTIEGDFFLGLVTNSMSVGGFEGLSGGHVDLQDGLFEVVLLRRPRNIVDFSREADMLFIHNKEDQKILDDVLVRIKTDKIIFRSEKPVQWVRDGENGGKLKEVEIKVCKKAVTIMSALNRE